MIRKSREKVLEMTRDSRDVTNNRSKDIERNGKV